MSPRVRTFHIVHTAQVARQGTRRYQKRHPVIRSSRKSVSITQPGFSGTPLLNICATATVKLEGLLLKYSELKAHGKLERFLSERRKRRANKDHKYIPNKVKSTNWFGLCTLRSFCCDENALQTSDSVFSYCITNCMHYICSSNSLPPTARSLAGCSHRPSRFRLRKISRVGDTCYADHPSFQRFSLHLELFSRMSACFVHS